LNSNNSRRSPPEVHGDMLPNLEIPFDVFADLDNGPDASCPSTGSLSLSIPVNF